MGTIDNVGPRSQHMTLIAWDTGVEVGRTQSASLRRGSRCTCLGLRIDGSGCGAAGGDCLERPVGRRGHGVFPSRGHFGYGVGYWAGWTGLLRQAASGKPGGGR
jgi:hypothetical protein